MLSILVCHSYFLRFDPKQVERGKPYPPLATLQVAAMLRRGGHQVALFDAMLAEGIEEYDRKLAQVNPQVVLIYEDTFNFLSKMCLGKMRQAACEMITTAHRAGARVIAAGPDVSDAPEPYLRAGADVTLAGEGLTTLLELIPKLNSNVHATSAELIQGLPGAIALINDSVVQTNGAKTLPAAAHQDEFAAWDLLDMDRYRSVWINTHGYFSLNMAASRGCSFRCSWCAKPIWGNQYLQRNAGAVAAAGGGIPFTIQTRADLLSERMAAALNAAGCSEAWLGAESGSQRVLDAMNKGTTVTEIVTARTRLKSAGIRVGFFIQLGYLDEQLSDILATRALLEVARPDDVGVSVSYPLPGTRFYELVKAQLGGKTHWQDSDDLAMMFRGTYTSEFYRAIRNLIHEQVSLQMCETDVPAGQNSAAKRALERRWHALVSRERSYRSQGGGLV